MLDNRIHLTQDYFSFVKNYIVFQRKWNANGDLQFHVFAIWPTVKIHKVFFGLQNV